MLKQRATNTRQKLAGSVMLFKPVTLLKWHRELVRRKWMFNRKGRSGRPCTQTELEELVLHLKRENPAWGYGKLEGELRKLGCDISETTIRNILARHGILPVPEQARKNSSWRTFPTHYKEQFLACDFFTVETLGLKTLYVLFFIEHAARRVYVAGCTARPTSAWVTQQARQLMWKLEEREPPTRFLIHDRDTKFTLSFDTVFKSEGIKIIRTPFHAPNANALAERRVRSVREECLDKLIILNERHLHRVLTEYTRYYNEARPHQGIDQHTPIVSKRAAGQGVVRRRDILGGIIHDYYREAA
jgi:transposase InsO family protein